MALRVSLVAVIIGWFGPPARAALVLEYIQVNSITAPTSNGPTLTGLTMNPGDIVFLQVALRDTIGSGPNGGAPPGTVNWQTNGGLAGIGSLGLGEFSVRFNGVPGVAVNPSPTVAANARLVNPVDYFTVTSGTNPPTFTRIGGVLFFGSEPGNVPDPAFQNRLALINLRIQALTNGSGTFSLRDPNPVAGSNAFMLYVNCDCCSVPNPCTAVPIDDLLFGPSFTNTFDLPVVVTPEPSGLALAGLAAAVACRRRRATGFTSTGINPAARR